MSSSVVSPIAETATTTSLPAWRVATIRFATRLMLSASATLEPPYFCTMRLTDAPGGDRGQARGSSLVPAFREEFRDDLGGVLPSIDIDARHARGLDRVVVAIRIEAIADEEHGRERDAGELGEFRHPV